jgi:hypothetical protein
VGQITGQHFFHEGFPPNIQAHVLRAVGFSEKAVSDILLGSSCGGLSYKFYSAVRAAGPRVDVLVDQWRQKLDLLAHQGHHVGIKSSVDIFKVRQDRNQPVKCVFGGH